MFFKISIVIPVYKEDRELNDLLKFIANNTSSTNIEEVLVVDFNNSSIVREAGVRHLQSPIKGRSNQLSYGGQLAKGDVLYFLHADSKPPKNFDQFILDRINRMERAGCFQMNFDDDHPLLRFFAWFTKFNNLICRGGDQSLWIDRILYHQIGGFDTKLMIMEDLEIIKRIKVETRFVIIQKKLITSARKYKINGVYNLQWRFFNLHLRYRLGYPQVQLVEYYKKYIR